MSQDNPTSSPPEPTAGAGRAPRRLAAAPRWLIGAAAISLCLNLAFIGLVAGLHAKGGPPGLDGLDLGAIRRAAGDLEPEARREMRAVFEARRPAIRAAARAAGRARAALADAIAATPYDAARVSAALAEMREARLTAADQAIGGFEEALARLDDDARAVLAERLARRRGHDRDGEGPRGAGRDDARP